MVLPLLLMLLVLMMLSLLLMSLPLLSDSPAAALLMKLTAWEQAVAVALDVGCCSIAAAVE